MSARKGRTNTGAYRTVAVALVAIAFLVMDSRGYGGLGYSLATGKSRSASPLIRKALRRTMERIVPLFVESDTVYAPDFTEKDFRRIQPGMSGRDVEDLMGSALFTWRFDDRASEGWYYSWFGGASENYYVRMVEMDTRTGKVIRSYSAFYLD